MSSKPIFNHIPRILAVLIAENGQYTYVDKLSYVTSADLAIYYLREALRDYKSLETRTTWENPNAMKEAREINMDYVERELEMLRSLTDPKEVREAVSFISAKALARANKLMVREGEGR